MPKLKCVENFLRVLLSERHPQRSTLHFKALLRVDDGDVLLEQ